MVEIESVYVPKSRTVPISPVRVESAVDKAVTSCCFERFVKGVKGEIKKGLLLLDRNKFAFFAAAFNRSEKRAASSSLFRSLLESIYYLFHNDFSLYYKT
jgi:hypothetical protein